MNWNEDALNMMAICSYVISIANLSLNQKQVSNDELMSHLDEQDNILSEQTETYLKKIVEQNEKIIELLKGGN